MSIKDDVNNRCVDGIYGLAVMDGSYGLAVEATSFPSFVEFWEAVETSVGSGTYGSFDFVDKVPSAQEGWTTCYRVAANDGLRRQLKARHVRDGSNPSPFTDVVTVAPWGTPIRRPTPPITLTASLDGQERTVVQTLTYEIPNAEFDLWESSSQPHAWSVDTGDSSSCAQDQATVFSGDSSAKYSFGAGGSAGTFRGLTTNDLTKGAFCIPLHPGTRYRFKFVSRVSSIANAPSYRVTLTHDVGGTLVTQQTYAYRAANKWQIDLLTFTVPLGAGPLTRLAIEYTRNATTATDFWQDGTRLQDIGTQRCVILTSGTLWTVPSDFNPANNTVELYGGGGGSAPGTTNTNGGGGGAGGTPNGGTGGTAGGNGGNATTSTSTDDASQGGPGGGGGGSFAGSAGGLGGNYGAGAGGGGSAAGVAGSGAAGNPGAIVISWITTA